MLERGKSFSMNCKKKKFKISRDITTEWCIKPYNEAFVSRRMQLVAGISGWFYYSHYVLVHSHTLS